MSHDPSLILDYRGMYPFWDGGVRKVRDFSGYGNHGTPANFVGDDSEYVDTNVFQGLDLSGTKHLNLGDILNYTVESFSFEFLIRPTSIAISPFLLYKGTWNVSGYNIYIHNTGRIHIDTCQTGISQGTSSVAGEVNIGLSSHIAIVRFGSSINIFNNGREVAYNAVGVHLNPGSNSEDCLIGRHPTLARNFGGIFSIGKSWNRALSPGEIYNNYINRMRV